MRTLTIDLPETAFAALRKAPDEFVREMPAAAAVNVCDGIYDVSPMRPSRFANRGSERIWSKTGSMLSQTT